MVLAVASTLQLRLAMIEREALSFYVSPGLTDYIQTVTQSFATLKLAAGRVSLL